MRWGTITYPVCLACCFYAVTAQADSCQLASNEREIRSCFEKAGSCGAIEDASIRLSCYDDVYKPIDSVVSADGSEALDEPPTAAVLQDNARSATQLDDEKLPLDRPVAKQPARETVRIQAKIVKLRKGPRGKMTISLDNGQIWRENEASTLDYRIDAAIIIKKGVFGSNSLTISGQNRRSKVKRIR